MDYMDIGDMTPEQIIDEFGELDETVRKIKSELKKLESRRGKLEKVLIPMIEKLDNTSDVILKSKGYVVKISRKGYDRNNPKYKQAFELAASKVNKSTRKILEEALESSKVLSKISTKLSGHSIGEQLTESMVTDFMVKLKRIFKNMFFYYGEARKGMNALRQLAGE